MGKRKKTCTLTTPRKTFCVAAMSSSLCSVRLGWMLSFWAASSTCCPDTVTDSSRDDIRVQNCILCLTYLPGSNISQPSVSANLKVTCWNVTFIFLYKQPCMLNFFVSVNSTLYVPGGHCCHVLCSFSHSLSRLLQLAELFWFLCTVTQQHQVAQMTCEGCHHLLHRRSPDQPVVQQRGHSWQSDSAWLNRKVQYHLLWCSRCFQCGGCMNNLLYSTEELDVRVS